MHIDVNRCNVQTEFEVESIIIFSELQLAKVNVQTQSGYLNTKMLDQYSQME